MTMPPLLHEFLLSLLRKALTIAATYLVTLGWLEAGDVEKYVAGFALFLISVIWSLWTRYKDRLHFLTALDARPGTSETQVRALAKLDPPRVLGVLVPLLMAVALTAGCASSGLTRVAVASDRLITAVERVQLAADALEQTGAITPAQRTSLSPWIVRLAEADLALNAALRASDQAGVRTQVLAMLTLLDDWQRTDLLRLPADVRTTLTVSIEAVRSVLLVLSTGVA